MLVGETICFGTGGIDVAEMSRRYILMNLGCGLLNNLSGRPSSGDSPDFDATGKELKICESGHRGQLMTPSSSSRSARLVAKEVCPFALPSADLRRLLTSVVEMADDHLFRYFRVCSHRE